MMCCLFLSQEAYGILKYELAKKRLGDFDVYISKTNFNNLN